MSTTENTIRLNNKSLYFTEMGTLVGQNDDLKKGIWPQSFPLWMAAFYVSLFIIRPWEQLLPWLGSIYFERIYAICMIATVLLSGKKRFRIDLQNIAVILFLFAIILSYLFAINTSLAWTLLYQYLTLIIFYFILILVIRTPYELIFMVTCYIVTMTVYLAKSQWEFFIHGQHRYDMGVYRLVGIENTFGGPNSLAMSIIVTLPIFLFLWSVRNELSNGWPSYWRRWFPRILIFYAVLAISSIIMTNSRSGMLSFVLFVLLATFRGRSIGRKLGYILLGVLFLTTLWFVLPEEKKGRFMTIWEPEAGPKTAQISAEGRIEGYKTGMVMFSRFPLTGVGIGNFIEYRVAHIDGIPLNPHNLYGQILGETGILGAGTFFFMAGVTIVNCFKIRSLSKSKKNRFDLKLTALSGLGLACRDAVILLAFEGLFAHNLMRFNWLWLAAFSSLALQFVRQHIKEPISAKGL